MLQWWTLKFKNYFLIVPLVLSGCVSVNLGPGKAKKSDGVQVTAPPSQFKSVDPLHADEAWQSRETGNTISYFSECQSQNESTIEAMAADSLAALSDPVVLKEQKLTYNQREAQRSSAKGTVDGVQVLLDVLVFKKNGCNYTITYSGIAAKFPRETKDFEDFLQRFKAP